MPLIRPVASSDTPAILDLIRRVYAEHGLTLYLEDEPHWLTPGPTFRAKGGDFWVLDDDGSVRGTVAVAAHPDHAEIKCLYLDPAVRGQGWGRRLVEHALAFIRSIGRPRVVLWSDLRFVAARAFYQRLGFQETGALRAVGDQDNTVEREFTLDLPAGGLVDAKTYVLGQFAAARRITDGALHGLTEDQFNWTPPGAANPIKASLLHLLTSEDIFINTITQGEPMRWDSGAWGERIGLSNPPGRGQGWAEVKARHLPLAPVLDYQAAVRAASQAYLERLDEAELARGVSLFGQPRRVADILTTIVAHGTAHAGEIAALRGIQGVEGLRF